MSERYLSLLLTNFYIHRKFQIYMHSAIRPQFFYNRTRTTSWGVEENDYPVANIWRQAIQSRKWLETARSCTRFLLTLDVTSGWPVYLCLVKWQGGGGYHCSVKKINRSKIYRLNLFKVLSRLLSKEILSWRRKRQ